MELVVLSADKLRELREAKKAGKEVDIHAETQALIESEQKEEQKVK